jgi:predicted DNA-binding transcriptional regulator AlpA
MPTPKLWLAYKYLTAPQAQKQLGLSRFQFDHRIKLGIFPAPTYIDDAGDKDVRYFDENWVRTARTILRRWRITREEDYNPFC